VVNKWEKHYLFEEKNCLYDGVGEVFGYDKVRKEMVKVEMGKIKV